MAHPHLEWSTLEEIARKHGILYEIGDSVVIGNISFLLPEMKPDRIEIVPAFGGGQFDLKIEDGHLYANEEQLLPLIQDNRKPEDNVTDHRTLH